MSSEIATHNEQWPVLVWPKSGVSAGIRNARSLFYVYTTALSTLFDFYLAPIARTIMHDIATSAKWATSVFLSSCATMAPKFKSVCENVGERYVQLPSKSCRRVCRVPRRFPRHNSWIAMCLLFTTLSSCYPFNSISWILKFCLGGLKVIYLII